MIANRNQIADIFGVAKTTVDSWVANGCPVLEKKGQKGVPSKYNTAEVYKWLSSRSSGNELDLQQERAALARKQAEKLQLQIDEQKGKLISYDEVMEQSSRCIMAVRSKLLALPTKMATAVAAESDPAIVAGLLKEQVYEALTELAKGSLA